MIEHHRQNAGSLSHAEIGYHVKVETTEGLEIRDVLIGIVYGIEAGRRSLNSEPMPDSPNLLLAFRNAAPHDYCQEIGLGRYFRVAASSVATIYAEPESSDSSSTGSELS